MEVRYENGWNGMFDRMNQLMRDFTPPTVAMNAAVFAHYQQAIDA